MKDLVFSNFSVLRMGMRVGEREKREGQRKRKREKEKGRLWYGEHLQEWDVQ